MQDETPPSLDLPDAATLADAFAVLVADARALDGSDDAAVRRLVIATHELTARVETVVRRAELAVRRDTTNASARATRQIAQRDLAPMLDAARGDIAAALIDPQRPAVTAALGRCFGEHYVNIVRLRERTTVPDPELRTPIDESIASYTALLGAAKLTLDGTERPLSAGRKPLASAARGPRTAAFAAQCSAIAALHPECDRLLADLVHARGNLARAAGFESFIDYRYAQLRRIDYGPEDVARFRTDVRNHVLPLVARIRAAQAREIGGSGQLVHPADEAFDPRHAIAHAPPPHAALNAVERALSAVAPELGRVVSDARRGGRVDLPVRAGKAPGAYCATFPDTGTPFVLTNLVGIGRDAKVLVHEFGHASQSVLSAPIVPWDLRKPTLDVCEIHSMALELLTLPHMHHVFAAPADQLAYARMLIDGGALHVGYCCAVDAFQHDLFAPGGDTLDAAARADCWERHLRTFVPGVDHDAAREWTRTRWVAVRHIFLFPFYFIDYAIAQVAAWQLWLDSRVDPEAAVERYLALCRRGGTAPFGTLLADAGIANPLEAGTVSSLVPRLEAELAAMDASAVGGR